jgi:hypothetical protein
MPGRQANHRIHWLVCLTSSPSRPRVARPVQPQSCCAQNSDPRDPRLVTFLTRDLSGPPFLRCSVSLFSEPLNNAADEISSQQSVPR